MFWIHCKVVWYIFHTMIINNYFTKGSLEINIFCQNGLYTQNGYLNSGVLLSSVLLFVFSSIKMVVMVCGGVK